MPLGFTFQGDSLSPSNSGPANSGLGISIQGITTGGFSSGGASLPGLGQGSTSGAGAAGLPFGLSTTDLLVLAAVLAVVLLHRR